MKLSTRLKQLREDLGLTQEQMGNGFMSLPGYVKLENGQRSPSEKLIYSLAHWLPSQGWTKHRAKQMAYELILLKHLNGPSNFVRNVMTDYVQTNHSAEAPRLLAVENPTKSHKGRPVRK